MKTISLAIPFYNTSRYFLDCIKYALQDDFISEIVVNDDCSRQEEYDNLLLLVGGNKKIKVYRNESNLGAFRNKYIAVKNCTNEWVYLLDSDNYPFEETYEVIRSIPEDSPDICFSPRQLFCRHDGREDYDTISDYTFKYDYIGIDESKDAIIKKTKWFDWFLNSGNYVFNRQTYLSSLKESFEDNSLSLLHADTSATYYFWLKNGGKFKIINEFRHNHRFRSDSYWHTCGSKSSESVEFYKEQVLDL